MIIKWQSALLVVIAISTLSCSQPEPASTAASNAGAALPAETNPPVHNNPGAGDKSTVSSSAALPQTPIAEVALAQLANANNAFGLALYDQLRLEPGNVFFSPHSIATALTMTLAGARSQTATQMAETLRMPRGNVHVAAQALNSSLEPVSDSYELRIANRLWAQQGMPILEGFLQVTRDHYGAELTLLNFSAAHEQARQTINLWVSEQTNRKIPELLAPSAVSPATQLVLTNAIYFKGTWVHQFDKKLTRPATFFGPGQIQVPMMYQRAALMYSETALYQALHLPYTGDAMSMLVLLPRERGGLTDLEQTVDVTEIDAITDSMASAEIDVWLPRFAASSQFKMNDTLETLGMTDAFSASLADFSGITEIQGLYITEAIHKAFVEVNEEGSEAAAATAVVMGIESESRPIQFRADHPFLFLIRDDRSGAILFFGRLLEPEA